MPLMGHQDNTFTGRLLRLQREKGAVIKCARKGWEGEEMIYRPRWPREGSVTGDPWGWVHKNDPEGKWRRFSGGDCYAVW